MITPNKLARCLLVAVAVLAVAAVVPYYISDTRAAAAPSTHPAAGGCDTARSVQVTGNATVNVAPDRALVRLGVQSRAATIDTVESANTAAIQKVIRALTALGIEPKDISTDIYVVEPVYEDYDSLIVKGYRISNQVAVTVRRVEGTSALVSAALKAGANTVDNVEFYTSELRKYRDQARDMAVTAASEKAQALARAAGAETGCVISITENSWANYSGWWGGRSQSAWSQNVVQNIASPEASTSGDEPISLGMIAVRAEVSASYSLL
jgi:uncharacterized protein YggE